MSCSRFTIVILVFRSKMHGGDTWNVHVGKSSRSLCIGWLQANLFGWLTSQRGRNDRDRSDQNTALLKPFWAILPHIHRHSPVRRSSGRAKPLLRCTVFCGYDAGNAPSTYNELWNHLSLSLHLSDFFQMIPRPLTFLFIYLFIPWFFLNKIHFPLLKSVFLFASKNKPK